MHQFCILFVICFLNRITWLTSSFKNDNHFESGQNNNNIICKHVAGILLFYFRYRIEMIEKSIQKGCGKSLKDQIENWILIQIAYFLNEMLFSIIIIIIIDLYQFVQKWYLNMSINGVHQSTLKKDFFLSLKTVKFYG